MKTKMFEVIGDVDNKCIALASRRAKLEGKIQKILSSKASRQVKKARIMTMLMELVNDKSSFSEREYDMLVEAKASLS